jgi:hypothetical protein
MIACCEGLIGTRGVSEEDQEFLEKLVSMRDSGEVSGLTKPQLDYLTNIYRAHFAG